MFAYTRESLEWICKDCARGRLQKTLELVCASSEFKSARRLIDLGGGGDGLFAIGFAQESPNLEVIVYDQPEIIGIIGAWPATILKSTVIQDKSKGPLWRLRSRRLFGIG